jgi:hypothetical protein
MIRIFTVLVIVCVFACNKKDAYVNAPGILMSHVWYPYKTAIITVDSVSIATVDVSGNTQVQKNVKRSDTSYVLSQCVQQSFYHFEQNGALTINDMCNTSQQPLHASWTITQTNMMTIPFPWNTTSGYGGFMPGSGQLMQLDNRQFVFNTASGRSTYASSTNADGSKVYEMHAISINESITFNSL